MKTNSHKAETRVLLRDLMKPVFIFGQGGQPFQVITELSQALGKLEAGESFYVYPGGDTVYHVNPGFYQDCGIPCGQVRQRLTAVFPSPPEAIGL
jgi:hypothetical protein